MVRDTPRDKDKKTWCTMPMEILKSIENKSVLMKREASKMANKT